MARTGRIITLSILIMLGVALLVPATGICEPFISSQGFSCGFMRTSTTPLTMFMIIIVLLTFSPMIIAVELKRVDAP